MAINEILHGHTCYVCGSLDGHDTPHGSSGIDVRFLWDDGIQEVRAVATFGPACQGAPGHAHGGSLFGLLDEAMGAACWMTGHKVMSANVQIDYRKPVRLGDTVDVIGRVVRVDGRKVHTVGELRRDGVVVTEAKGLFISSERHAWDVFPTKPVPDATDVSP